jgi:hypothetical protein
MICGTQKTLVYEACLQHRAAIGMTTFHVEIVKPSHYDREGYVIQW